MIATLQSLGIDQLSLEQRLALVQDIWDSVAAEQSVPMLTELQRQELIRRIADDDANPNDVIPWEQVRAEILDQLQKP